MIFQTSLISNQLYKMKIQVKLQKMIGNNAPFLIPIFEPISRMYIGWRFYSMNAESIFTRIYKKNYWAGYSRSGPGSDLDQAQTIIKEIPRIVERIRAESILDMPCGDFNWQKYMNLDSFHYIGADIVPHLIQKNNRIFSRPKRQFVKLDIRHDVLPKCDLLLCRDLFQHLSFEDIWSAISNIKSSNCKYLLASSQINVNKNSDVATGGWRKINLLQPPFSFPKPILILNEGCPIKYHSDKSLLLWRTKDL